MQVSKADQLADDAAALTPLQGASAAKAKLAKPSCQDEPMEQPAGTALSWPHPKAAVAATTLLHLGCM